MSELIRRLSRHGIEVDVLAPSYRGLRRQVVDGITVHRFRYAPSPLETLTHDQTTPDRLRERPLYLGLVPGYILGGSLAAVRLARSGEYDVIHAFWPIPHGLLGLAARAVSGVPLVCTFFGVELTWLRRRLPVLAPLARWIVRAADAVTVISTHTETELRALVPERPIRRIPFGAAIGGTAADQRTPPSRHAAPHRILFVGRLVERKGVGILLRALALIRGSHDVLLTVVGDGPLRRELQALSAELGVEPLVDFRGYVAAAELSRLFSSSDVFVLPAVEDTKGDVEGLGVVLIEALRHGLPVVASDSGGIRDIVVHEKTGLLVPPGDAEVLAAGVARFLDDPQFAARTVASGQTHVANTFSWERITSDLAELYREMVRIGDGASKPRGRR